MVYPVPMFQILQNYPRNEKKKENLENVPKFKQFEKKV